jgi:hypothetical protein
MCPKVLNRLLAVEMRFLRSMIIITRTDNKVREMKVFLDELLWKSR